VDIGRRLKDAREQKNLSQGDIEKRTGLLRCYISRVECGHTVPALSTIEKIARALEMPAYQLFIGAERSPSFAGGNKGKSSASRKQERQLFRFANLLANMKERDRTLLLKLGSAMAGRRK
jgi:transcriptional regulator with XRE-family HTH domain